MTLPLILVVLTMPVFRAVAVVEPKITLLAREDDDTVKLLCWLEDFYPKTYTNIMWLKDKTPFSGSPVTRTIINNSKTRYYQISEIYFDAQQLNKSTEYTCQARHNPEIIKSTWSNYKAKFSLKINPPSEKDLFEQNKAVITCVITGDNKNEVEAAKVSWTFGEQPASAGSTVTDSVKETTAPFTKTSTLSLSESEWFSEKEVKCSTERDETPFSETIKVKKGGKPSILFYKPEKHVSDTEKVSLLCEVSSSDLGDVYIIWKMNNGQYRESSSTVHTNANTVLSYLTVTGNEYNRAQFACVVKDPNMTAGARPEQKTTSMNKFSLKINPPSEKDLFVQNKAIITCVITGDNKNEVEAANVSWTVGGQTRTSTATDSVKEMTAPFTKTSNFTLSESEWFSGSEVKCSTERDETPFLDKIKVKKGGERPSILFYRPENNVRDSDKVSLLCEVSSSDLGDVYIMWQKNGGEYMEGSSTVHINDNTVLSYLTVSGREYNDKNNKFACAVKDANKENDTTPRTNSTSASKLPPCPLSAAD